MPIYTVTNKKADAGQDNPTRMVRAANKAQALRHVADEFVVEAATQDDLVMHVSAGVKVEDARDVGEVTA
jgi:hypothetical protein